MPPPTPRRKLLPPPPEKGEKDPLPEGLDGFPKDLEGLLPNPLPELPEPPKDLPPLLERASASSESPRTITAAKSESRSAIRLTDEILFNMMSLQYDNLMILIKK
jgi:hypothetical protein